MRRFTFVLLLLSLGSRPSASQNRTDLPLQTTPFTFEVRGNTLAGVLDVPVNRPWHATIIIVHGYGKTNAVKQNWHYGMRAQFAEIGIRTLMWDKPGCGESEGEFDINQPVASSAEEILAAIQALRKQQPDGPIGLWGISRAGWIAPLAMQEEPAIDFWISVSGTDDMENAKYLIESNLRIEGRSEAEVESLVAEWQARFNTVWQGGTYQEFLGAAPNLAQDPFMIYMGWGGTASEEGFLAEQQKYKDGTLVVNEEAELMVYVPEFRNVLGAINKPVLALFGEKDTNVDWRKTMALYQETIGANPDASLIIKTFPDGDHTLRQSKTGGIREMNEQTGPRPYVEGYYQTMRTWLVEQGFGTEP